MKYNLLLGTLLVLVMLFTSCGTPATPLPPNNNAWATSVMATRYAEAAKTIGTLGSPLPPTMVPTPRPTRARGVKIQTSFSQTYGTIIVGAQDLPVYIYTNDVQNGDTSACGNEACALEWPPVRTIGMPIAGKGVRQELLGTITRPDGIMQATYNGWPLYYAESGLTDAHGQAGRWFLVSAQGNPLTP